jgi:hypothetical protein
MSKINLKPAKPELVLAKKNLIGLYAGVNTCGTAIVNIAIPILI